MRTSATFQIKHCFSWKQLWECLFRSLSIVVRWCITLFSFPFFFSFFARTYFRRIKNQGVEFFSSWNQRHLCHEFQNSTPAIRASPEIYIQYCFLFQFSDSICLKGNFHLDVVMHWKISDSVYENLNKCADLEVKEKILIVSQGYL